MFKSVRTVFIVDIAGVDEGISMTGKTQEVAVGAVAVPLIARFCR